MAAPELFTQQGTLPGVWRYSVIRKAAAGLSGIVLVAFLFGHWSGNRALLAGEAVFDAYMVWLAEHPILHYGVWGVLLVALLVHLATAPWHWFRSRRARPVRYRIQSNQRSTWAGRTMIVSGILLLVFLIVHVAHVRGWLEGEDAGIYRNMQAGFRIEWVVAVYVLGQLALGFHLYHGVWSFFQTSGISHPLYDRWRRPVAVLVGVGIALLNAGLVLLSSEVVRDLVAHSS